MATAYVTLCHQPPNLNPLCSVLHHPRHTLHAQYSAATLNCELTFLLESSTETELSALSRGLPLARFTLDRCRSRFRCFRVPCRFAIVFLALVSHSGTVGRTCPPPGSGFVCVGKGMPFVSALHSRYNAGHPRQKHTRTHTHTEAALSAIMIRLSCFRLASSSIDERSFFFIR